MTQPEDRLPEPYALMDRPTPATYTFRVLSWETGRLDILTRHTAAVKPVELLRLHVPPEDKPDGPAYIDVTSRKLIAMLQPLLPVISRRGTRIVVTVTGEPPATEYQLAFENP